MAVLIPLSHRGRRAFSVRRNYVEREENKNKDNRRSPFDSAQGRLSTTVAAATFAQDDSFVVGQ
jgi:hypothetical protein